MKSPWIPTSFKRIVRSLFIITFTFLSLNIAQAQTFYGTPGSPSASMSLDTQYLPAPALSFGGEINLNAYQSTPWWPPKIVPPKNAPNILLIITDDVGYAAPSTFGGSIPTTTLDDLAKKGLRYTNFHSTALCSPTRAALITGRNHHSVGFGVISEMATGYPGYNSVIGKDTATIAQILKDNGYATSWFGKNHNTPEYQASQVGPFDQWPTGMGFDYFYGFVGGDTSQWQPNLFRNTSPIYPYVGKPNWNLTTAMADDAIAWLKQLNEIAPNKPFFVYYAPGGTHAPHHPTPEWIAKFKGKFDQGWNQYRKDAFARQKASGVIPQNAVLTDWPDDLLPEWDSLNADQKKMYARQAEVYAAYLAYTDYEIGRVIEAIGDMGKLDNTVIIYISGDNGSSAEGTPIGTPNEVASFNGVMVPVEDQLKDFYDIWGSDETYPHMSVGWTWAFDTPFKWTKQIASYFGGVRQGMVIVWPNHIKDAGGIRNQFSHVIDIEPTILEITGIKAPVMVDGIAQKPIEGTSLFYTFDKTNANAPSRHHTQYFEMLGNIGIYQDGWIASTDPIGAPWLLTGERNPDVANSATWHLYDLSNDPTQSKDVKDSNPQKLLQLQQLFWVEAAKYQVLPLDNTLSSRLIAPRPSLSAGRNEFTYKGVLSGIPHGDAPSILNKSFTITANITVPKEGGNGILVTEGGRFAGFGLYLLNGKPNFTYNLLDLNRTKWEGKDALSPGNHTVEFDFTYDGGGLGKGGMGTLKVDNKMVDQHRIENTIPFIFQWDETFDVGIDTGTSVDDKDYQSPFAFNGTIQSLTLKLIPVPLSNADQKTMDEKSKRNNSASE